LHVDGIGDDKDDDDASTSINDAATAIDRYTRGVRQVWRSTVITDVVVTYPASRPHRRCRCHQGQCCYQLRHSGPGQQV
jgi:hypothetical protein